MKRKLGTICMLLGTVLVLAALSLLVYNRLESDRAGNASESAFTQLQEALDERVGTDSLSAAPPVLVEPDRAMTTVRIDGYDYIGYLSIPSISLELPIMSEWSYAGLKLAPGRFSGSTYGDNLVICGHNYARHFSPIKWLTAGTEVYFTDMDGVVWQYEVLELETLDPAQVEDMTGKADGDSWDLTLFTCTTGGQTRCAVRCIRIT